MLRSGLAPTDQNRPPRIPISRSRLRCLAPPVPGARTLGWSSQPLHVLPSVTIVLPAWEPIVLPAWEFAQPLVINKRYTLRGWEVDIEEPYREVRNEGGIVVENIRYFGSQL